MKYRRSKTLNYKKLNRKPIPKAALIIGIIVAAILVIALIAVAIVSIVNAVEADKTEKFNAEIKEIQIARKPNKLSYYCDTSFDTTGMMVYSLTNGGEFTKVNIDECTITGFDSSAPVEEQTITVTYKEFTATFTIEIKEKIQASPTVASIAIHALPKTEYKIGEGLKTTGGVIACTYTDGSKKYYALENKHVSGFKACMDSGVGEYELTVKYTENGVQATTTYKITISE